MTIPTKADRIKAAMSATFAISEAIRELQTVPSGHLYAQVMGSLDIETYTAILNILTQAGVIRVSNDLITWIGPNVAPVRS